jgi:hypothetical protein
VHEPQRIELPNLSDTGSYRLELDPRVRNDTNL